MIFVTGDTHGREHIAKLASTQWPQGQELTHDDFLVICGDFGAIWSGGDGDKDLLAWHDRQPWTTLFVDGNHENHDLIRTFPVEERFGGNVQVVPGCENVIHLMRGEVYDLPVAPDTTARAFVMGGAPSTDKMWRVEGRSWWAREMPSDEEYDRCTASLEAAGWRVDYVLTHEMPADLRMRALDWRYYPSLAGTTDRLTNYLQWVWERLDRDALRMWYAGHYHVDLMAAEKCRVLYRDVVPMDGAPREVDRP
jgi:hypothetical protein